MNNFGVDNPKLCIFFCLLQIRESRMITRSEKNKEKSKGYFLPFEICIGCMMQNMRRRKQLPRQQQERAILKD